ncbi:MAG: 50S ribosomal protein L29 [Pirellulales bacterium]
MAKAKEIRDMGDEQIRLVWKDAAETLFRLRIQAQTEKLAAPTEMKKHRRTIARCQTILSQRGTLVLSGPSGLEGAVPGPSGQADASPRHEKHAKKHHPSGRAKLKPPGKEGIAPKRTFKKRTQSGT